MASVRRFYRILRWVAPIIPVTAVILILRPASPPKVTIDREALQRLALKMQRLETQGSSSPRPSSPGPSSSGPLSSRPSSSGPSAASRSVRLDEAEVNGWIQSNLNAAAGSRRSGEDATRPAAQAGLKAPTSLSLEEVQSNVRDVKVHMTGDLITAYVLFNLYGKDVSLTLEGRLSAQEGYARLSPTRMQLGSLPIPQATVESAVRTLLDSPANREKFRLPPDVKDLHIENGDLVVNFR